MFQRFRSICVKFCLFGLILIRTTKYNSFRFDSIRIRIEEILFNLIRHKNFEFDSIWFRTYCRRFDWITQMFDSHTSNSNRRQKNLDSHISKCNTVLAWAKLMIVSGQNAYSDWRTTISIFWAIVNSCPSWPDTSLPLPSKMQFAMIISRKNCGGRLLLALYRYITDHRPSRYFF